jgi:hypothetical protein
MVCILDSPPPPKNLLGWNLIIKVIILEGEALGRWVDQVMGLIPLEKRPWELLRIHHVRTQQEGTIYEPWALIFTESIHNLVLDF